MTDYRFDAATIRNWTKTPEGFIEFMAPIAREGFLAYSDGKGGVRREYVSREVLHDSAKTFIKKPVTKLHPDKPVTARNARKHTVGWTANGAALDADGVLWLQGTVFDADTIDSIESGETTEISCGYKVRTVQRGDEWHQVKRIGNHVAAVPKGRAGPDVAFQVDGDDTAYWCFDSIDASDLEPPEVNPPPKADPPLITPPKQEKKTMKVTLDGLEIEVADMAEAKHVRSVDQALTQARSGMATLQTKLDSETAKSKETADALSATKAEVTQLTTALDEKSAAHDQLKLDYDEAVQGGDRGDGAGVDIRADKLGEMIADRMGLWNQVLPFMRSDDPDFKPDFSLDPIGIMAAAVKTANPHLADQLDGLDLKTDSAQGMIKGLFLALDATKEQPKPRTTVDSLFADVYQGRAQVRTSVDSTRNDARMDKVRQAYRDAHKS